MDKDSYYTGINNGVFMGTLTGPDIRVESMRITAEPWGGYPYLGFTNNKQAEKPIPSWMGPTEVEELRAWRKKYPNIDDPEWARSRAAYDDYWTRKRIKEATDYDKERWGWNIKPAEYAAPGTDIKNWEVYIGKYRTFHPVGRFGSTSEVHTVKMNRVTFKNLHVNTNTDIVVYSIDGIFFNIQPSRIILGEHMCINDPDNLMKLPKAAIEEYGMGITNNLNYVAKMDEEQGLRAAAGIARASISFAIDVASIIIPILRPVSTAAKAIKIISRANSVMSIVIDFSDAKWEDAAATGVTWILGEQRHKFLSTLGDISSVGIDIKDLVKAFDELGYTVKFVD